MKDKPLFFIKADFEKRPFIGSEIKPPEGFKYGFNEELGKAYPRCCNFHRSLLTGVKEWFRKFPDCCDHCRKIEKTDWFKKEVFNHVPKQIVNSIAYTEFVISQKIDSEDWYEAITGFFNICVMSFGNPAPGLDKYIANVNIYILNIGNLSESLTIEKRDRLVKYFDIYRADKSKEELVDPNVLHLIIQQWIGAIPDLPFFEAFKAKFTGKFITNLGFKYLGHDPYLGPKYRFRTIPELFEVLNESTSKLLDSIDSRLIVPDLIKEGIITDTEEYGFRLTGEKLRKKHDLRFGKYSGGNYVKFMLEWLVDEVEFFKDNESYFKRLAKGSIKKVDKKFMDLFHKPYGDEVIKFLKSKLLIKELENGNLIWTGDDQDQFIGFFWALREFGHSTKLHFFKKPQIPYLEYQRVVFEYFAIEVWSKAKFRQPDRYSKNIQIERDGYFSELSQKFESKYD